jgi:acyl dehydratase
VRTEPLARARGAGELAELLGRPLGPTSWTTVTQEDNDAFAELSGDRQWIHVDVERAREESPWGTTIAHGDLLLARLGGLRGELLETSGFDFALNRGWRSVLFPASLPAGEAVCATTTLLELNPLEGAWLELVERYRLSSASDDVCVAESVTWLLPTSDA